MASEQFANLAQTTLNNTLGANATLLVVTSASNFPSTGNFRIIIDTEILLVTGVTGTNFTVTRGYEGTAASLHSAGATVAHIMTAGVISSLYTGVKSSVPKLSIVGQRCGGNGEQGAVGSSTPYLYMHTRHLCPGGADAIQLVYSGLYLAPQETALPPSVFSASGVTLSGGSGYAVGDINTYAISNTTGMAPVKVMVTMVSSGVPTQYQVIDAGIYNTPLSSGASQVSTTGSGSGATAVFTWKAFAAGLHISIEPVWNMQAFSGTNCVEIAHSGSLANGLWNWNALVPMGEHWVSDLIPVDVPVGGAIGIRAVAGYNTIQYGRIPNGSFYRGGGASSANDEFAVSGSTFFEIANNDTLSSSTANNIMQPALILGIPKKPLPAIIAGFADSRAKQGASGLNAIGGNCDPLDADGNCNWFEKTFASSGNTFWPWANFARGSDRASYAIGTNAVLQGRVDRLRAIALAKPTAVYVNLSINDFINAESLSALLIYEQQLIAEIRGCGVKYVFTDTTDPNTSSSDSWATKANQGLEGTSANQLARNQGLRNGSYAPGYDFFIDQAANVSDPTDERYWITTGVANASTGDGIHASPAIIANKAATASAVLAAKIIL
jgi:hypothetical protein